MLEVVGVHQEVPPDHDAVGVDIGDVVLDDVLTNHETDT